MKTFDIWVEGYAATGSHGTAQLITTVEAESFKSACEIAYKQDEFIGFGSFNIEKLTLWGCRLFDNEADARKAFG